MPLDTGVLAETDLASGARAAARRPRLTLDPGLDVGEALRAVRLELGLSLDKVSEATRVKARHLAAIEASDMTLLPSRPFAIGYVRAYAKAVGLDADQAAARFRAEHPSPEDDDLHSPVGVEHETKRGMGVLGVAIAVVAAAILVWNVSRHAPPGAAAKAAAIAPAPHPANAIGQPFTAGAPLPAPPEASIPAPYVTPGLDAASAAGGSADAADAAVKAAQAAAAAKPADPNAPARRFVAQGAVYGPAKGGSDLIIQADGPISLMIRGPGGVVYFARELSAGEAYRAPNLPNLTAESSNPAKTELYEGGVSKGPFAQGQIPLKVDGDAAPAAPRPAPQP